MLIVAHRLVLGTVGLELRSVQTDVRQRGRVELQGQFHRLNKAAVQQLPVCFSKVAEYPEVGAVRTRDIQKSETLAAALFDLPGTEHAA